MIGKSENPFRGGKVVGNNVRYEDYARQTAQRGDRDYSVSRGDLIEVENNPHRWFAGYEREGGAETEWGELVDCLTLTPQHFRDDYAVAPATYQSKGMKCPSCGSITDSASCRKCKVDRVPVVTEKPWDFNATPCAEWKEANKHLKIRKAETVAQAENAVKILYGCPETREVLEASDRQVMVVSEYHDKETGIVVPVRILVDLAPRLAVPVWRECLGDLKTATNAGRAWAKTVYSFGYHVQAAFYLDVWNAATGEDRQEFFHVVQESFPPWEPARKILTAEFVELGRWRYQAALQKYAKCLSENKWPGYSEEFVSPEPWMINQ